MFCFFFSSRRRHTRSLRDWSSDVCSSDLQATGGEKAEVDHVYDVPAELAKDLTGYRHDQDIPGVSGDVLEVLVPTNEPRRSRSEERRVGNECCDRLCSCYCDNR